MKNLLKTAVAILMLASTFYGAAQQDRGTWQAASNSASNITGDIALSETKLAINFKNFTIAHIRSLKPEEVGAVFDADVNTAGSGALYKLEIPATQRFLHKSTLCGEEKTQWMATYSVGKSLRVAFFSGDAPPTFTFDAISNSSALCGTFTYAR
jgi:hypothetical protein